MGAYTGAAVRASYSRRPAVPGVDPVHAKVTPDKDLDPFQPVIESGPGGPGTIWEDDIEAEPQSRQPHRAALKTTHWWPTPEMPPVGVPDGATSKQLGQSVQNRRNGVHSFADVIPNSSRMVRPAGMGRMIEWLVGNDPRDAGRDAGSLAWLANGRNGYDQTNGVALPYSGDDASDGRRRLGRTMRSFGINSRPTAKNGQDIMLRAAEEKHPQLNQGRDQVKNPTPYSSGFLRGNNNDPVTPFRQVSSWASPSSTSVTDRTMMLNPQTGNPEFTDNGDGDYL